MLTLTHPRPTRILRWTALGILSASAAFWIVFAVADGLSDARRYGAVSILWMLALIALVAAPVAIAWRRPRAGAALLLVVALFALSTFNSPFVWLTLAAPYAIAAVLLVLSSGPGPAAPEEPQGPGNGP